MMRWKKIGGALRATRSRRWAVRYLKLLALVALLSSFLANDRPIVAHYAGELRFPVFRQIAELVTGPRAYGDLPGRSWRKAETTWAIWPPIPYDAGSLDYANGNYRSPFGPQKVESWGDWHWLGTDRLGRDVTAGMIRGARIALLVGIVAMTVALLIGLLLGGLAGYFGNDRFRCRRYLAWALGIGGVYGLAYGLLIWWPYSAEWPVVVSVAGVVLSVGIVTGLLVLVFRLLSRLFPGLANTIAFPFDFLVLRLIELFNSFPTLILLLATLPVIDRPSILTVMLVIGLIRWTSIARFVRAELLRIRQLPYIDAARLSGFGPWRILFRHALPNALGPVVVALSFGVAGAILLEAYLSFLSIGLPSDQVSWGSLLRQSRDQPAAWWLAVFPGLAIFFTVLALNVVGDALKE